MQPEDRQEAQTLALQMQEWVKACQAKDRCPIHRVMELFVLLYYDNEWLKNEIERIREYPDEA